MRIKFLQLPDVTLSSLSQQKGDEAEEGVTSEGMTTQTSFVATFSGNILATPTLRFTFSSFLSFFL